jgi:hypothetical protein
VVRYFSHGHNGKSQPGFRWKAIPKKARIRGTDCADIGLPKLNGMKRPADPTTPQPAKFFVRAMTTTSRQLDMGAFGYVKMDEQ